MTTLRKEVQDQLTYQARYMARVSMIESAIEALGIGEMECYVSLDFYSSSNEPPVVVIHPSHTPGIGIFMEPDIDRAFSAPTEEDPERRMAPVMPNMRVTDTTPILSQIARKLLPKVGKLEKGFDAQQNQVTLTATYGGVRFILKDDTPSTCSVERVEEEEEVPEKIIPAYKQKKISYRLVGDCDPILADASAHFETAQGAIELEEQESK